MHAIYYPMIRFRSAAWLKTAALFWDSIARIVPPGYTLDESAEMKKLGKFVRTVGPETSALTQTDDSRAC